MNQHRTACSQRQVEIFLNGGLDESQQAMLERHLETCESCQQALDAAAASADDWVQLRRSLSETTGVPDQQTRHSQDELAFFRRMLSPTDDPQMLGRVADYEIIGMLGHGGMGVVFKGFDARLNRYVAIKLMAPQFAASGVARQRFFREAQAAAAIVHEHVMAIHSVAVWQDSPYLVMPYLRAVSLQQRIEREGALPLRELLRIGYQIASGLAAAHAQGLIHRDVKPANILMEEGVNRVVLTDFGLARAVDDIRLTRSDTLVGTPQYMSPEQVNDESLDFRTDLFSLGSVLYEAGTGCPAFQAVTSYGVLRKINDSDPVAMQELNPDLPDWFAAIVERLMAKRPEHRYQTAADIAVVLQQCLAHIEHPKLSPLPKGLAAEIHKPRVSFSRRILMSTIALSCLLGLTAFLLPTTPEPAAEPVAEPVAEPAAIAVADEADREEKYSSAREAFSVGAAFYNSRNFKASREPFEAAIRLAKDSDPEMILKCHEALLPSYRLIPEFEPFQTSAEYVLNHHPQSASRSLTRRSYLAFAFQRGQMENIVKRYEEQLQKDPNNWMAVYLLSEIYSNGAGLPPSVDQSKRAIELIQLLAKLEKQRHPDEATDDEEMSPLEAAKIAREQSRLAMQYMRAKEYLQAAQLYEKIAPLDKTTQAWNLKEAASAYLKLNRPEDALRVAMAAHEAPAEARNDQLTHFFHRNLGDTFMALDKPELAVPHYEIAIQKTTIEGYLNDTKASLQKAIEKSK
ncbi:MAG: protein kinase [Planctomycetaceae bacterium]